MNISIEQHLYSKTAQIELPIEAVFAQEEEIVKQLESLGNDSFGTGLFKYVS